MASDKDGASGGDDANGNGEAVAGLNTGQAVLQYFWDMASYDENVRVTAARGLVKDLTEDQSKHLATLGKDTDAPPEDGTPKFKLLEYHLRRCSPTMVYTLRRLARGLGSSRQAARQGYATALAGLLAANHCVSPAGVLVLLEVCIDGPLKGTDAKDTLLGRLFGYGALLRSGLALDPPVLAAMFNGLLDCGQRKSFLRECSAAVAVEAAQRLDRDGVAALAAPGQPLATLLATPAAEATPEALLLALVLWPKLPDSVLHTCCLLPRGTPPPPAELFAPSAGSALLAPDPTAAAAATAAGLFSREHLTLLLPVLQAASASHPRLHTLWQYLLPLLLPGFKTHRNADLVDVNATAAVPAAAAPGGTDGAGAVSKKAAKAAAKAAKAAAAAAKSAAGKGAVNGLLLEAFWGVVVEGKLMESSNERRYMGFQLFSRILPHLRPENVPTVFSPTFTHNLAHSVQNSVCMLHACARKVMDGLAAFLDGSADSGVKLAVAAALQRQGGTAVEQLHVRKITRKLVKDLDSEGVHRYVVSLMEAFLAGARPLHPGEVLAAAADGDGAAGATEEEVERLAAERRKDCVDLLLAALKFPAAAPADCEAVLRFLALHAFARVERGSKASKSKVAEVQQAAQRLTVPLSADTRAAAGSRLVALLALLKRAEVGKLRAARQQRKRGAEDPQGAAAAGQPAAKKRKTSAGGAAAAAEAAAAASPPFPSPHQYLHDTLSYIRKVLRAPGVSPAAELGEVGDNALLILEAVETTAKKRLEQLDNALATHGQKGSAGPRAGATASRIRSLAALAGHLQLHLLMEPEGFEMDLPLSLRRIAAEGLGLEGLPEVEVEQQDEEGDKAGGSWCDVLVDVMLALMARPAGPVPVLPMREAAESLWRQCCEELSAEGLLDIARVVAAGAKGEGQDGAALFESEEEEEDGDDDEGRESDEEVGKGGKGGRQAAAPRKRTKAADDQDDDGSGSESQSDGDDDEDGEDPGHTKPGKNGKDDGEDEDEEALDDEAMFRLDSKLAAYLRSMVGGRAGGVKAAARAAALLDFRLRALGLLELFAKKVPHSPLLLTGLVPLLRALATASRPGGQPNMATRLRGAIINKIAICKCRVDLAAMGGLEGYQATLKRVLYEASRNRDKVVAEAAWAGYISLIRAGAAAEVEQPEAADAAKASFRAAVTDLLTKKKTRLHAEAAARAFRVAPVACLPSLDLLLHHVAAGRSGYVRAAASELLLKVLKVPPEGLLAALTGPTGLGGALGGALVACVAGVGLKPKQHVVTARVAVSAIEPLKRLLKGRRLAEVFGADKISAIAKAVMTVQSLSPSGRVDRSLKQLVDVMALGPLLEKTKPDPALAARIQKARPGAGGPQAAGKDKGGKGKEKEGKEEGKAKGKDGKEETQGKGGKKGRAAVKQGSEEEGKGRDKGNAGEEGVKGGKAGEQAARRKDKGTDEGEEEIAEGSEEASSGSDGEGNDGPISGSEKSGSGKSGSEDEEGDDEPGSSGEEDEEDSGSGDEERAGPGRKRGGAAAARRGDRRGARGGRGGGRGRGGGSSSGKGGKRQQGGGGPAKKARR